MRLELVERDNRLVIRFSDLRDKDVLNAYTKGVGNKWKNHRLLQEANIPQIKTIKIKKDTDNTEIIKQIKNKLKPPYVIKLTRGMKGEDIYLNLTKTKKIKEILNKLKAKIVYQRILIQEQSNLKNEYRVVLIGKKIISVFAKRIYCNSK